MSSSVVATSATLVKCCRQLEWSPSRARSQLRVACPLAAHHAVCFSALVRLRNYFPRSAKPDGYHLSLEMHAGTAKPFRVTPPEAVAYLLRVTDPAVSGR